MPRAFTPLFLSLALTALVACSSTSGTTSAGSASPTSAPAAAAAAAKPAASAAQVVAVQGTDSLKFEPASITVKAGQPVQLSFSNTGQTLHDWSLAQGAAQPVKITAAGGQTESATFTIDRPGTYTFICSQPGHEAAGMKGTLTAQ